MPDGFRSAKLHDMSHTDYPHWMLVRHHLGIRAFGINAWMKGQGEDVIPKHDESASGHEELYLVTEGHATFTVDGAEIEAPAGTAVFIEDPKLEREAISKAPQTTVVSIGGWADKPFKVSDWEAEYLEGQSSAS